MADSPAKSKTEKKKKITNAEPYKGKINISTCVIDKTKENEKDKEVSQRRITFSLNHTPPGLEIHGQSAGVYRESQKSTLICLPLAGFW